MLIALLSLAAVTTAMNIFLAKHLSTSSAVVALFSLFMVQ